MTIIFKIKAEHNKIVQPFFYAEELNQIILKLIKELYICKDF